MPAAGGKQLWHLDSFSGGIDRRDGAFTETQSRSFDLVNMRVKNNKRAVRRPPCSRNATAFVNCQGLVEWRGALYTVAKKGDAVTKPATVTGELRFDNPDHCTAWELAGLLAFGGFPVALIKHTYPGGTVTHQWRLHVFDGKANKPTYVEDPWCPTGWGPTLPLHLYRTGTAGAFDPLYVPRMTVCGGRLYMSRPDGNLGFSKTGDARVWNERTVEDMQDGGEWFYFITNTTSGEQQFVVSEAFDDLSDPNKWAGYVVEYLDANGTWVQATEEIGLPLTIHGRWKPESVTSRFGGPNEIRIRLYWTTGGGTVLRFRIGLKPDVSISGVTLNAQGYFESFNGNGVNSVFNCTTAIKTTDRFAVYINNALVYRGTQYDVTDAGGGAARITTTSPPSAGVGNIDVIKVPTYTKAPGATMTYQGQTYNLRTDAPNDIFSDDTIWGLSDPQPPNLNAYYAAQFVVGAAPGSELFGAYWTAANFFGLDSGSFPGFGQGRMLSVLLQNVKTAATGSPAAITSAISFGPTSEFAFYLDRTLLYQLRLAGADDAGDLPTAGQQGADGGYITALSAIKDRLLVSYKGGTQLWQASGAPEDFALLGFGPVGTGEQVYPEARAVGQSVVLGMARGLMSLNLSGSNLDSLRDINLGEPIEDLGFPQQMGAAFWPITGEYVTAVEMPDATVQFLVFDYSPEQKINSWSRWTVASLPDVERFSMVSLGRRLYFRAGGYLYDFNEAGTDFIDAHDGATPYESLWMPHFNHFRSPFRMKQCMELEWVMSGVVTVSVRWNPDLPDEETGELVYTGQTAGRAKVPAPVWGHGLAPVVRSRDRAGFEIEEFGMWFRVLGR